MMTVALQTFRHWPASSMVFGSRPTPAFTGIAFEPFYLDGLDQWMDLAGAAYSYSYS
jgi:hypothetical protein